MNAPHATAGQNGSKARTLSALDAHQVVVHPAWQHADFISDIHLHPDAPGTAQTFIHYCQTTTAAAVFILGDLFEVWIGDDALDAFAHEPGGTTHHPFEWAIVDALRQLRTRAEVYIMRGNRDFLLGAPFFHRTDCQALADPCVLISPTTRVLLSHGDAWCTGDHDYLRFREITRTPTWQQHFLALSRSERQAQASALRARSAAKQAALLEYIDVDIKTIAENAYKESANVIIHGHTHRPESTPITGSGVADTSCTRHVLPDWHFDHEPAPTTTGRHSLSRGHALRWTIHAGTWSRVPIVD